MTLTNINGLFLVLGYILAVPPLFVIIPKLGKKSASDWPALPWILAEMVGAALIALGWFSLGNILAGIINAGWLVIFSGLWLRAKTRS